MRRITLYLVGALAVWSALDVQLSTLAQGTGFTLLTITNPMPAANANFGWAVAAVGTDRVLIGARLDDTGTNHGGAAYLFSVNGVLLTTFTNPTPVAGDEFGWSVAPVGTERVLIGARFATSTAVAAYLFSTSGALLTTFTNPTPAADDNFGWAVAAMGTEHVLIGALYDDTGAMDSGEAYLFSANGALLTTFTNPTPESFDNFGVTLAAVGTDQVLIGARYDSTGAGAAGAAYLFSTNGALLTTFTNPTPAIGDFFGFSVAAVGPGQLLIGAPDDDTGASAAGAAYLFSTNGALLTTFTNPTPEAGDHFGFPVAAGESGLILIGASGDNTGSIKAGAAYLFSTNGTLLTTFTNPLPAVRDGFGASLAAVGTESVLIGARTGDAGASDTGVVYLFSNVLQIPESPSLTIRLTTTNTVAVSWPSPSTGWTLQQNTNGAASVNWSNAPGAIQDDGTNKTLIVNPPTGNRFYRLFKP